MFLEFGTFLYFLDWKDIGVKKPSGNTWSSLADKISELQYNIQRNSILEGHMHELLNKQL